MSQSLGDLEQQRSAILDRLTNLGEFQVIPVPLPPRQAAVARPTAAVHRPNVASAWTPDGNVSLYKVEGKSVSESLANPSAVAKTQREVAEICNYQQISQQFVEVNTRICQLRPVTESAVSAQQVKNGRRRSAKKSPAK